MKFIPETLYDWLDFDENKKEYVLKGNAPLEAKWAFEDYLETEVRLYPWGETPEIRRKKREKVLAERKKILESMKKGAK